MVEMHSSLGVGNGMKGSLFILHVFYSRIQSHMFLVAYWAISRHKKTQWHWWRTKQPQMWLDFFFVNGGVCSWENTLHYKRIQNGNVPWPYLITGGYPLGLSKSVDVWHPIDGLMQVVMSSLPFYYSTLREFGTIYDSNLIFLLFHYGSNPW